MIRFAPAVALAALTTIAAAQRPYLDDFAFIRETVAKHGAAVESKKIPWKSITAKMRPRFAECTSDVDHVTNVMALLATLRDSHTGVTRSSIKWDDLPSKWDGLYGGGMWFGYDRGLVIVRGVMAGHPLEKRVPVGSVAITIDGWPAWLAMEREQRRIARHRGISSAHSLFASMGNRFLPFGDKQRLDVAFFTPDGDFRTEAVPRWGPDGRAFSMFEATVPPDVKRKPGAVSTMLTTRWSEKVGYLRITGSMNRDTAGPFHRAFDALRGMEALVLDCRGMGGGGDRTAWELAGRLFPKAVDNGRNGRIEPSGDWQFDGPVVMLQDEIEVSSAETFTWAVSETERVISVGRPTGGWSIIPKVFKCPSGLVDFRLGVNDRPTPIRGIRTEGTGWPPDVLIPYGPIAVARDDAAREVALAILECLHGGAPVGATRDAFAGLFAGRFKAFDRSLRKLAKRTKKPAARDVADWVERDLAATLDRERTLLTAKKAQPVDAMGAAARFEELAARGKAAGMRTKVDALQKALRRRLADGAAQRALLDTLGADFDAPDAKRRAFLQRHGRTPLGKWTRDALFGK